ncbi:ArsR/SmtB family transcription factor [Goodfellowiella coeruleoviolacea]|uniref:Helix-turn-helix domain-containing protein n=1 Tax=Goodfellowiella coeruleoviolacea TaxID=334858 RepID=A0AAE3GHP3_9PSEU|nr:winged helix-turn-helix domain-containing protein [Goodfellowiella coeruleoviolacea]MCP2168422.1 Helix-turn-helix domain-containing protein [Goodfellowiella coeruleoviolacea]
MAAQPAARRTARRQASRAEAAALASDVRLRIIRLTTHRALTNKEIAGRLGKDPATTLHHVRKLVATGFLEALPERRGTRGAREIPYRSTGLSWHLDGGGTETGVDEAVLGAFLGEVAEVGPAALTQTRLILELDEHHRAELERRLHTLLDEFAARPVDPDGERVAVYLALYPGR